MKKLCCALLSLVLALSLAACGGPAQKLTPLSRQQFVNFTSQSQYAVLLKSNAAVKLYYKSGDELLAVQCVNEPARALFDGVELFLPVASPDEFTTTLLDAMRRAGYLKDKGVLHTDVFGVSDRTGTDALAEHVSRLTDAYLSDAGLSVKRTGAVTMHPNGIPLENPQRFDGLNTPAPVPSDPVTPSLPPRIELGENETVLERDEAGNILKTEERDDAGNVTLRTYNEQAQLVRTRVQRPDGSWVETDYTNGLPTLTVDHEGNRTTRTYHYDLTLSSEITQSADGTYHEVTYDLKGNMTYFLLQHADGSWEERNFISGGKPSATVIMQADGTKTTETYHYNGVLSSHVISSPGGYYCETNYNENGKPTSQTERDAAGNQVESSYYANGNRQSRTVTHPDGSISTWYYTEDGTSGAMTDRFGSYAETYHPNGKRAKWSHTVAADSGFDYTYEEYTYSETGATLTHTKLLTDGRRVVSTYLSEKAFTSVFTYPDGGGHTEYWIGNTHIGGIDSNGTPYGSTHGSYTGPTAEGTPGKG